MSMKSVHDVEDSFSNRSINCPYLLPEMYVFTLVRKRGVIFTLYKVFIRHLNEKCFELAVPAIFLSYAPTFFDTGFHAQYVMNYSYRHSLQLILRGGLMKSISTEI